MDLTFDLDPSVPNLSPDEIGYIVSGIHRAAVRLTRANGAAPSMHAITACAYAVDAQGLPILTATLGSIEGSHTASCIKAELVINGQLDTDKVEALKRQAIEGALTEMVGLVIAEQAFDHLDM